MSRRACLVPAFAGLLSLFLLIGLAASSGGSGQAADEPLTLVAYPFYLQLSFPELVQSADAIVIGVARGAASPAVGPGGLPEQLWTVDVERTWKGAPGPTLVLAIPGGTSANGLAFVHGQPDPVAGQRAVFFLSPRHQQYRSVGGWQGYHPVGCPSLLWR